MNCCYLLLQHLHLLTAVRGERSEVRVQHYKAMRSPERFPPRLPPSVTSCHWPAPLRALPALSADGPGGSETHGCPQRISASARGPAETAATGWDQNHVCVGLRPLIPDYKLGHSCQCKHLHDQGVGGDRKFSTARAVQVCLESDNYKRVPYDAEFTFPVFFFFNLLIICVSCLSPNVHHLLIHWLNFSENVC